MLGHNPSVRIYTRDGEKLFYPNIYYENFVPTSHNEYSISRSIDHTGIILRYSTYVYIYVYMGIKHSNKMMIDQKKRKEKKKKICGLYLAKDAAQHAELCLYRQLQVSKR